MSAERPSPTRKTQPRIVVALQRLVRPARIAVLYLNPDYAPYKMRVKPTKDGGWATFYKGQRKVWECNATFAEKNFDAWPNSRDTSQ